MVRIAGITHERSRDEQWAPSGRKTLMTTESVTPKTSESTSESKNGAPAAQPGDIAATVDRLRKTFATGRTRDIDWRKRQVLQLQELMEENEPAIAAALADDLDR